MKKICKKCGKEFEKGPNKSMHSWLTSVKYCSKICCLKSIMKNCANCKKQFMVEPNQIKRGRGKLCSIDCAYKARKGKPSPMKGKQGLQGERNPRWKGGISSLNSQIRGSIDYREWHRQVLRRDYWKCVICGSKDRIEADHILSFKEYPKERFESYNGQTLCYSCHKVKTFGFKAVITKFIQAGLR